MTKLLATLPLLFLLSGTAIAGPTQPPRAEATASRQPHRYWLSQDFQRLVFWQAPPQSGPRR